MVSREIAGETLIVPVRGKVGDLASIYSFNGTGTLLWQLLDSPRTSAELVEGVEREYDVARQQAEVDVTQFVTDLFAAGLLDSRTRPIQSEAQSGEAEMPEAAEKATSAEDSQKSTAMACR